MSSDHLSILGLEPFDRGSHRAVRESITRHGRHDWHWLTRPGRAWKWRMRTAAIELAAAASREIERRPDAIFTTSLLAVADLRALLPQMWRDVPIVLYMHENQAAYPSSEAGRATADFDAHFALTNLTSVLAANAVIWNSDWNRRSFLAGIETLLGHHPDPRLPDVRDCVEAGAVVWPPVELPPEAVGEERGAGNEATRIVWPHRAEHDKGPEQLLETARAHRRRLGLRWVLLGERYGNTPPALDEFRREFADCIEHDAYEPDRHAYWRRLAQADWVLSTAHHEFFGIAVAEALLAGCLPWLPDRLSYPEILPPCAQALSPMRPPEDAEAVRAAVRAHLEPALAPNAVKRIEDVVEGICRTAC